MLKLKAALVWKWQHLNKQLLKVYEMLESLLDEFLKYLEAKTKT